LASITRSTRRSTTPSCSTSPTRRSVALEMDLESAKTLVAQLQATIAEAEASGVAE
jgi:hypothetical protein